MTQPLHDQMRNVAMSLARVESALEKVQRDNANLKNQRSLGVKELASYLAPDLKASTISTLEAVLPKFFTPDIEELFAPPTGVKRFLSVFIETRDKKLDLQFLQTKLRATLDGMGEREVHELMKNLEGHANWAAENLKSTMAYFEGGLKDVTELVRQRSKLREELAKLEASVKLTAKPTREPLHQNQRRTSRPAAPALPVRPKRSSPTSTVTTQTTTTVRHVDDSNSFLADALIVNMLLNNQTQAASSVGETIPFGGAIPGGSFGGAGASGSWDQASVEAGSIATDDSLGRFS